MHHHVAHHFGQHIGRIVVHLIFIAALAYVIHLGYHEIMQQGGFAVFAQRLLRAL